jgi:peptidyl-prolyl cis-trans isomerase C
MENKVLATVGGIAITSAEVDEFILGLGQRGAGYNTPEGREMVLSQLIDSKLLLLDARKNLLETEAEFKAQLAKLRENLLINYAADKVIRAAAKPTEKEISDFYEENKDKFIAPETVNASHILVDTEDEINAILADIKSGKVSFEDAARASSKCPSGKSGGSLGDFGRGQMVPEFESVAFDMKPGEISEPVKTQFGYHIIKLIARNESQITPLETVKADIERMLAGEKQKAAFESKINQLKILYPVDRA